MPTLETALYLVVIVNRLIEGFATPFKSKYPNVDTWWLIYVSWAISGVLVYFTDFNLFAGVFSHPVIGQVLTSVAVGYGSNLLSDLSDRFIKH